jgi:hypothetical protein
MFRAMITNLKFHIPCATAFLAPVLLFYRLQTRKVRNGLLHVNLEWFIMAIIYLIWCQRQP